MKRTLPGFVVLLGGIALGSTVSAQQTWTVGSGSSSQFTQITTAVAAAADGDVILVENGWYDPFVISGKGLTVVAGAATAFLPGFGPGPASPAITVENLAAHQRVHLLGIYAMNMHTPVANVLVQNCSGSVWIEDMFSDSFGAAALRVENCDDVVLVGFFAQTNSGITLASGTTVPMPGAHFSTSTVRGADCTFVGSHFAQSGGPFPTALTGTDGGHGIEVVSSRVDLQGGAVGGGSGNGFWNGTCLGSANGGHGALLTTLGGNAPAPELRLRDVAISGGSAAYQTCGGATGIAGQPWMVQAGQVVQLTGRARLLDAPRTVLASTTATFDLLGEPNDLALVFAAFPATTTTILNLPLHLTTPAIGLGFAMLGVNREGSVSVPIGPLGPGSASLRFALQALMLDGNAGVFATNPRTLLVR